VVQFALGEKMATTGDRIREVRESLGWTQQVLADKAGLSKGFLSDVENGHRGISSDNLLKVANALGATLDYLTGNAEQSAPAHQKQQVVIPDALSQVAASEGWTYAETIQVLEAYNTVVARRSAAPRPAFDQAQWKKLYAAIKTVFNQ
jgi:transcriptional regulator with XRE-family HTH domain